MTPFRVLCALVLASLFSQFPAFSNQYMLLMQAEISVLDRLAHKTAAKDGETGAVPAPVKPELARQIVTTGIEPTGQLQERLAELRPDLEAMQALSPVARLAHPGYLDDPKLLRATWLKFTPSLPIGTNGLIAAVIGFALGWMIATALGLFGPRRRTV